MQRRTWTGPPKRTKTEARKAIASRMGILGWEERSTDEGCCSTGCRLICFLYPSYLVLLHSYGRDWDPTGSEAINSHQVFSNSDASPGCVTDWTMRTVFKIKRSLDKGRLHNGHNGHIGHIGHSP